MNRNENIRFIKRMLARLADNSSDQTDAVMLESAAVFLDRGRWERERQQFFLDTPQAIGFAGEVAAPNSYLTTEVIGIPILVARAEDGILRAFINACTHRGAQVARGCGTARRLTCGFHGWSYSLNGQLAGRPREQAFDPATSANNLMALPVSDRSGLIVVGLQPDMSQQVVDDALLEIGPALQGFGFETVHSMETRRYEVNANWKLVTGLSHESYHFNTLHRDSLGPVMTDNAICDTFGCHSRWGFAFKGIENLAEQDVSTWPERFPGAINHTIFPGTVVVVNPTDAQMIRTEPGAHPGHSVVYFTGVCSDLANMASSRAAYDFGGNIFATEDLPAAEQCHRGIAAGLPRIEIGRNEPVVQYWHRLWSENLK